DFSPVLFSAVETAQRDTPRRLTLTNTAVGNAALAAELGVSTGDVVLIRFGKASKLSMDASVSLKGQPTATLRLKVHTVATNGEIANFSPDRTMTAPANIFVPLSELARAAGLQEIREVNHLVAEDPPSDDSNHEQLPATETRTEHIELNFVNAWLNPDVVRLKPPNLPRPTRFRATLNQWSDGLRGRLHLKRREDRPNLVAVPMDKQLAFLAELLDKSWDFQSAQIANIRETSNSVVLTSSRVFIDSPVVRASLAVNSNAQPIFTYLATLLQAGTNATPYSMVTAAGPPWTAAELRDDEILISQWLAEDLQAGPGDEIAMSYFLPESGAKLTEATNRFRVRAIVPVEMPWADHTLMPDFPGIEKAERTSDWNAGFPLTYKIRPKDEDYWKQYRGTPKAFITLAAGQKMWANRFGNLTAIRFPIPTNSAGTRSTASQTFTQDGDTVERVPTSAGEFRAALEKKILATLKPEELGLRFEPVREQALKAAAESQDFGGLFLGFSFFLIAAALLLMALLFSLGLEQRAPEIGTLLALGFTPKQVRNLLLCEGVALSLVGGVLGALGGLAYAKAMLHGLTTVWRDAVGASALGFHFTGQTLVIGLFASVVVSAVTIWLTLRKFVRRPAAELLTGETGEWRSRACESAEPRGRTIRSLATAAIIAWLALTAAVLLVGSTIVRGDTANAGAFFGAGALALVAGLGFVNAWLARLQAGQSVPSLPPGGTPGTARPAVALGSLGMRGCARRRKRSLATVAMLACGSFLIVSIGVFRLDANRDAWKRSSGTGGFALIGETTMPVVHDLNSQSGRDFFALSENDLKGVGFVSFRVREGDQASCLNLNRARRPKLLGVRPELLEEKFIFAKGSSWLAMRTKVGQASRRSPSEEEKLETGATPALHREIPAIGDANSIQWAMHKKVGDTIDYLDERDQPFKVRIVGAVANSILQGQLIIDEAEFVKQFPSVSGYRMFLIDAPSNAVSQVSATLSRAMQDVGLELTPAVERLAQFNAVQNTYLGTFQVLGGLGLLLGSVGLGIVVLRNVLERRGELAVMLAVGFRKSILQRLLLLENGALLAAGLALGLVAAVVAVLPELLSPSAQLPFASLALTLGAVLVNGALWTWVATHVALRGDLLAALRNE
ncbi:MAG: ABC transporter permease, partial [Verrucomicrobia bacterium]|nr:ABC transporter permease [Verrucomicrobiota bacterium]